MLITNLFVFLHCAHVYVCLFYLYFLQGGQQFWALCAFLQPALVR